MPSSTTIQSVQRAIDIMNCFRVSAKPLSLAELAERCHLNVSTCRGIAGTLVANGLLIYNRHRKDYHPGLYFMEMGELVAEHLTGYTYLFEKKIANLAERHDVTVTLQVLRQKSVRCILHEHPHTGRFFISVENFRRHPLHATASGKLLLSLSVLKEDPDFLKDMKLERYTENTICSTRDLLLDLAKVKKDHVAFSKGEFLPSVDTVAVPVFSPGGHLDYTVAAVNLAGHPIRDENHLIEHMKKLAVSITEGMAYYNGQADKRPMAE